jgi:hypothetical protein
MVRPSISDMAPAWLSFRPFAAVARGVIIHEAAA